MERIPPRPRFIPASKLPLIEIEAGFLFPPSLLPTVESLGYHPHPSPDPNFLMLELSSKISLEAFQTILRAPETKQLDPESESDEEPSDEEVAESQVIDICDDNPRPLKRRRFSE